MGYGQIHDDKMKSAHRVSHELHTGPIPSRQFVLHSCDTPHCVNPSHLFLGTQQDNIDDMNSKGRAISAKGEDQNTAKLTEEDVHAIRADERMQREIAVDYGVHQSQISMIKARKTWSHI